MDPNLPPFQTKNIQSALSTSLALNQVCLLTRLAHLEAILCYA